MPEFTHLHLHTQYSLLDGAIRLDHLFPKVLERGMKSVAVTDHGNMFGALDFYQKAKAARRQADLRLRDLRRARSPRQDRAPINHLILLAKNEVGWKNLSYLNSMGYLEGFYYNPRIDKPLLREHTEGLIGLSACLGGEIAQTLDAARAGGGRERGARSTRTSSARGTSSSSCSRTASTEQETGQRPPARDVARRPASRSSPPTTATT